VREEGLEVSDNAPRIPDISVATSPEDTPSLSSLREALRKIYEVVGNLEGKQGTVAIQDSLEVDGSLTITEFFDMVATNAVPTPSSDIARIFFDVLTKKIRVSQGSLVYVDLVNPGLNVERDTLPVATAATVMDFGLGLRVQATGTEVRIDPVTFFTVPIIAENSQYTNQPAGDQEWRATSYRVWADLGNVKEFRVICSVTLAGVAGSDIRVQYATSDGGAWTNLDGASGPELALDSTGTKKSSWTTLPVGAKQDVILRSQCKDGDGVADPNIAGLWVQFR